MTKVLRRTAAGLCAAIIAGVGVLVPIALAISAPSWDAADFTIESSETATTLRGFSDSGLEKVATEKHVVIPGGVTVMDGPNGQTGNMHSRGITGITLPTTLTEIGYGFLDRNAITSVDFPAGMTTIEPAAFQANKLTEVTLPASVQKVRWGAFKANNIAKVTLAGTYSPEIFDVDASSTAGNQFAAFDQQELADAAVAQGATITVARLADAAGDLSDRAITWKAYFLDDGANEPTWTSAFVTFSNGTVTGVKQGSTRMIMLANDKGTDKPIYSAVIALTVTEAAPEPAPKPTTTEPAPQPTTTEPAPQPTTTEPAPQPTKGADNPGTQQPATKQPGAKQSAHTKRLTLAHTGAVAAGSLAAMALLLPAGYALRRFSK